MNYWYLLLPLFSACTGWLVIWFLQWLVFHPREPKKFFGKQLQGILPAKQKQFAQIVSGTVAQHFFPAATIRDKLGNPAHLEKIMPRVEEHIDDFLKNKLSKEIPMLGMFIGDKMIAKVKEAFMREIALLFPTIMQEYGTAIANEFDIKQKVSDKILSINLENVEKKVHASMQREVNQLRLLGLVVGFITGLLQLAFFGLVA